MFAEEVGIWGRGNREEEEGKARLLDDRLGVLDHVCETFFFSLFPFFLTRVLEIGDLGDFFGADFYNVRLFFRKWRSLVGGNTLGAKF